MDVSQEAEMLRNVPLFSGMSASELKLLAFTSEVHCFAPGEILMRQGDPADCAYVILEGEADVLARTHAGEFVVATLGRNAVPGEIGVLTDAPRTATVRATTPLRALRISPEVFLRLASSRPDRALHVMRQLSAHIANDLRALATLKEELSKAQTAAAQAATR
ncbi:MAG TPA: cyclic nucleotide-binding domain-containing protein [Casimicrobiaceae bacterium]|nr:cyclic nucleotide-binding domain-containing protein [Casimicrobiaceae bacterium]